MKFNVLVASSEYPESSARRSDSACASSPASVSQTDDYLAVIFYLSPGHGRDNTGWYFAVNDVVIGPYASKALTEKMLNGYASFYFGSQFEYLQDDIDNTSDSAGEESVDNLLHGLLHCPKFAH